MTILKSRAKIIFALGVLTLSLSACGVGPTAYSGVTSKLSVTADGTIDLNSYDPDFVYFEGNPIASPAGPRYIPNRSNGKAKIKLDASYDGGNWNVNGSYADGDVKFTFKGFALIGLLSQIGPLSNATENNLFMSDLTQPMQSDGSPTSRIKTNGGACVPVLTHYESTNRNAPGTGYAIFLVCDAPRGASLSDYTGEDYVKVFIPENFNGPGDLNPYGNYLSGGFMGRKSTTQVKASTGGAVPSATPAPLQPYPSPSESAILHDTPVRPGG